MSEQAGLFICIECELAGRTADPAELTVDRLCKQCGSSSVASLETLGDALKSLQREQAPLSSTREGDKAHAKRVEAMRQQRKRDSEPLRHYVATLAPMNENLSEALAKWDGWAWHLHYPWDEVVDLTTPHPAPGHFVVELVNGVKNAPRWYVVLDTSFLGVK